MEQRIQDSERLSSQIVRSKQDGTHKCLMQNLGTQGIAVFRYLQPMVAAIETYLHFLIKICYSVSAS